MWNEYRYWGRAFVHGGQWFYHLEQASCEIISLKYSRTFRLAESFASMSSLRIFVKKQQTNQNIRAQKVSPFFFAYCQVFSFDLAKLQHWEDWVFKTLSIHSFGLEFWENDVHPSVHKLCNICLHVLKLFESKRLKQFKRKWWMKLNTWYATIMPLKYGQRLVRCHWPEFDLEFKWCL